MTAETRRAASLRRSSLFRTGRHRSRRGFLFDGQQFDAAPRTTAAQQPPANNFHGRHIRKSHGEVFLPQLLGRRTKAFVPVYELGALWTRRAVEHEVEPGRNWLATDYDRPEFHRACLR